MEAPLRSRKPADRLSSRVSADPDVPSFQGIFLHLFYRSRVAVKSLDAGIRRLRRSAECRHLISRSK